MNDNEFKDEDVIDGNTTTTKTTMKGNTKKASDPPAYYVDSEAFYLEACSETSKSSGDLTPEEISALSNGGGGRGVVGGLLCCWNGKGASNAAVTSGDDLGVWESSLEDRAGCMSEWLLSYLTPYLRLGANKVLEAEDVGVPSKEDLADEAFSVVEAKWNEQVARADEANRKRKEAHAAKLAACTTEAQRQKVKPLQLKEPSISTALIRGFGACRIFVAVLYYIVSALLQFVPVLILNDLVRYFEYGPPPEGYYKESFWNALRHPWIEVAALALVPFAISALHTRNQVIMAHCATFARTAVSTLLYRKSLRVSAAGRAQTSTGQVVNMMSNDTAQLQRLLLFLGMILGAPIQIIIALVLIYQQVGNATWVGIGYMVILSPVNTFIFSIVSKQRRRVLHFSDLRVKMMNEVLAGIRIIKFYAWERPFRREVSQVRKKEVDALTKLAYTTAVGFSLILLSVPLIQPILVFMTYVAIQDEPLDAATAFTTVALFNMMRFPFAFLPMGFLQYIQSKISLRRLEKYLALPELAEYVLREAPPNAEMDSPGAQECSVTILNGSFSWVDPEAAPVQPIQEPKKKKEKRKSKAGSKELSTNNMNKSTHSLPPVSEEMTTKGPVITLRDISCTIESGSLVAVVGSVGSGKSSFLSAILGEMEPIHDSKVYIPSPPARRGAEERRGYVSYCAQTPWVVNDTLRGNLLFGREMDTDRYERVIEACALRDDLAVLPAGDMTEIGERGINLSGGQKARVSLARALYARRSRLVLLDDPLSAVDAHVGEHIFSKAIAGDLGKGVTRILVTHHVHLLPRCDKVIVLEGGTIRDQGTYAELVARGVDFAGAVDVAKREAVEEEAAEDEEKAAGSEDKQKNGDESSKPKENGKSEEKAQLTKSGKKLVKDEEHEAGSVAGSAYMHYARAGGLCIAVGVIVVAALGRGCELAASFWLAHWANESFSAAEEGAPFSASQTNKYLGIYAMFGLLGVAGLAGRAMIIAVHRLRASNVLHADLVESVMRAPVAFFDVTPTGRILNRFAADMDKLDLELTQSLSQGISTAANVLGAVGAIVAATKGTFLIPMIPMSYVYYMIQKWFRKTSTEMQRLNSIANSPIFADFSQSLSGTSTIRAYDEEARFFNQCKSSFDTMNASYMLGQLVNAWLGLRLDVLGGLVGAFIGAISVATSGFIPAGWLGLALSYSIEVTAFLKHGVRVIAMTEAHMASVERVLYYTHNIEAEAPEVVPDKDPEPGKWPLNGEIKFSHASMRYRDGPLVLKDISLRVKAGEKVGVCGRTGSGKSSLMIALFRISELENDGGKVIIDGVDAGKIGTEALRLNLSIIPQDPVVFSNTVRYNLDPFEAASNEEVWDVLKKVQMDEVIAALPGGLEEVLAESGENLSQGQRQLLCIARSLLRKPKILVMDEATASIDNSTDAAIQDMVRENFKSCTVLTIAHRLNTIMDSDRILVLDDGRIAEYDSPEVLLAEENGHFRSMVEKTRSAKSQSFEDL